MLSDDTVIKTREQQDRIFKFVSVFPPELRESIQNHFLAVQGNVSEGPKNFLCKSLSHGLRVELARWVWREFLTKVYLFRGCNGQFLDALCVILHEDFYGVVIYVFVYICMCECLFVCLSVHIYMCMCVFAFVRLYLCVLCIYLCVYSQAYTCTARVFVCLKRDCFHYIFVQTYEVELHAR